MKREEWDHETWHGDIWADATENLKPHVLLNLWLREVASFSLKEQKKKKKLLFHGDVIKTSPEVDASHDLPPLSPSG